MTRLADILKQPIRWQASATDSDLRLFLDDLQANIMKGHGRGHAGHIFLSFACMKPHDAAAVVRILGQHCTSAARQLRTNRRDPPHLDGGAVRCLFLSAGGYQALGVPPPPGTAFSEGMARRRATLADPPRSEWSALGWRDDLPPADAMFLIADADPARLTAELKAVEGWLHRTDARVLVIERGLQQTRTFPGGGQQNVEHFGYVDGRSQPLFLQEDLRDEPATQWQPGFSPSQVVVADPNGRTPLSAGSFFVFRKLEQNVRGFKAAEARLADKLFGTDADDEVRARAGAMVIGRFENGTPLVLSPDAIDAPPSNDFTFDDDPRGAKCPFHAHIRKTNPRGDVRRQLDTPDDGADRAPIMARRGITYGAERPKTVDGSRFDDVGSEPRRDVGLLFMAYMASIEDQFEVTQARWANDAGFVRPDTGIDPVIGQGTVTADRAHAYLDGWTPGSNPVALSFAGFVKMLGGEYFFAPSLSFLRGVGL